jgi:hypothetical protein
MIYKSLKKVNINNKTKYFNLLYVKAYKSKEIFKLNNKNIDTL